jgi:hypothetical protein
MATTLEGAPSYTITVPDVGRVTYRRGEELPAGHIAHVPDDDRGLFDISGGPSPKTDADSKKTPSKKSSSKSSSSTSKSNSKSSSSKKGDAD